MSEKFAVIFMKNLILYPKLRPLSHIVSAQHLLPLTFTHITH